MRPLPKPAFKIFACLVVLGLASVGAWATEPPVQVEPAARVLVVYHSPNGHTAKMAEAVARGVRKLDGVAVSVRSVESVKIAEMLQADALILGCPVYNANVTPELQAFINRWPFEGAPLRDKVGAAFTTAGGISAGEEVVQLSILAR